MITRVNSLGRKRIPQSCVSIEVLDGSPRTFTAGINLPKQGWPDWAHVVMEATAAGSTTVQRFECGTVGHLIPPLNAPLSDLRGQNVFFALKIIDRREQIGRLLGIAENIRPEKAGNQTISGRKGILPVERKALGQQLWLLEYGEHDVFLVINSEVPGLSETVRSDPVFYSLIYPQIIRQILAKAIGNSGDPDADDDTWSTLWLSFARKLHPTHENPPDPDEAEEVDEWIEAVVTAFCDEHKLRDRYVSSGHGDGE